MGTVLKWVLMKSFGRSWSGLMWLRIGDRWQAFAKTVMNLRVPKNAGISLTRLGTKLFKHCSVQFVFFLYRVIPFCDQGRCLYSTFFYSYGAYYRSHRLVPARNNIKTTGRYVVNLCLGIFAWNVWSSRSTAPHIPDMCPGWGWMVSYIRHPQCLTSYLLDRKQGGSQTLSEPVVAKSKLDAHFGNRE